MKKILLSVSLLLVALAGFAQSPIPQQLDSLFNALHAKKKFNGNVLIAEKGKVIFQKSYGNAQFHPDVKLNDSSIFELASVSKQFTAMSIYLLSKKGKLKLTDKLSKHVPELAFYDNITIQDLIYHTSGLPDYMELMENEWDKQKIATNMDIVSIFQKTKPALVFEPGTKFEYSNTGYALLGLIVEKTSGKTYGQYLQDNIFKPLQMNNTFVHRPRYAPRKISNYAYGYVSDSLGKYILLDELGKDYYTYYLDGIVGDGMVNSTTSDLLKWDRALYANKFINEEDKKIIFSKGKTKDGKDIDYGFGWGIGTHEKYGKIVNHSGGWAGYTTLIERQVDNDKTIIMLQNLSTIFTVLPTMDVRKILYNEPLINDDLKTVDLSIEALKAYEGSYYNEKMKLTIKVFVAGEELMAQADGQNAIPLTAYENHTFKFDPANIKLTFNLEESFVTLLQGKFNIQFQKVKN
jgi:CubicO group peptidase (beta-lactamase class C family)